MSQKQVKVGAIRDVSGEVNIAGGHIVHAENGATVIIGTSASAVGGLVALSELIQYSSDVRAAVITFQNDFLVTRKQVDQLGDYKELHDLLHRLQFHCYNCLVQAATTFPTDELTLDNLTDYSLTLEEIVEELKQVATRSSLPEQELVWISEMGATKVELCSAIESLDEKSLKKVVWRLNRVLAIQPARINTLLNKAARTLRLPSLSNALMLVCNHLTSLDFDAGKVDTFRSGVDALSALDNELSSLVNSHDGWQALDIELRRIGAFIDHDLTELEMSWGDIKPKSEQLYVPYSDESSYALKKECAELDNALISNNPAKTRRCFRSFQRRVADRFYRVDLELKALCNSLRLIGTPLASVLRMIE